MVPIYISNIQFCSRTNFKLIILLVYYSTFAQTNVSQSQSFRDHDLCESWVISQIFRDRIILEKGKIGDSRGNQSSEVLWVQDLAAAPRNGGRVNAAGLMSTWGTSTPRIIRVLKIHSLHQVARGTPFHVFELEVFGFWFVMPPHNYRINYIRHAYKLCSVIICLQSPDRIERHRGIIIAIFHDFGTLWTAWDRAPVCGRT